MNWDDSIFIFADISDTIQEPGALGLRVLSNIKMNRYVNYKTYKSISSSVKLGNFKIQYMEPGESGGYQAPLCAVCSVESASSLGIHCREFQYLRTFSVRDLGVENQTRGLNFESLVNIFKNGCYWYRMPLILTSFELIPVVWV